MVSVAYCWSPSSELSPIIAEWCIDWISRTEPTEASARDRRGCLMCGAYCATIRLLRQLYLDYNHAKHKEGQVHKLAENTHLWGLDICWNYPWLFGGPGHLFTVSSCNFIYIVCLICRKVVEVLMVHRFRSSRFRRSDVACLGCLKWIVCIPTARAPSMFFSKSSINTASLAATPMPSSARW